MSFSILLEQAGTYGLKSRFQSGLRPAARALAGAGIRANQITISACVLAVCSGVALLLIPQRSLFVWLPLVLLLRMALNAIDGMLAREFGQASTLGMYLNEIGDVVSDVFLILPFAHLAELRPFWIWIIVVLAIVSEMAGVLAAMAGSARRYDGPMGKSDRAVVFGAAGFFAGLGGSIPPAFIAIVTSLLAATVVHRVLRGIHAAS